MSEENKEVKVVENDSMPVLSVDNLKESVEQATEYLRLQDTIRKTAICVTNKNDWVDEHGSPYLEYLGACKIARAFGVSWENPEVTKQDGKDEKGDFYIYRVNGVLMYGKHKVSATGTCSTRNKFFLRKNGQLMPLSEIDETNVDKKAWANWMNRGIKILLGLSFTWEEVEKYSEGKITRSGVTQIKYNTGSKGGSHASTDTQDVAKKRQEISDMVMEICGGDEKLASETLEKMTTFTGKDGNKVKGKTHPNFLTAKQVIVLHPRVKSDFDSARGGQQGS